MFEKIFWFIVYIFFKLWPIWIFLILLWFLFEESGAGDEWRRKKWKKPELVVDRGYVNMYVQHVQQADKGADLDFLVGKSGSKVMRDSH